MNSSAGGSRGRGDPPGEPDADRREAGEPGDPDGERPGVEAGRHARLGDSDSDASSASAASAGRWGASDSSTMRTDESAPKRPVEERENGAGIHRRGRVSPRSARPRPSSARCCLVSGSLGPPGASRRPACCAALAPATAAAASSHSCSAVQRPGHAPHLFVTS